MVLQEPEIDELFKFIGSIVSICVISVPSACAVMDRCIAILQFYNTRTGSSIPPVAGAHSIFPLRWWRGGRINFSAENKISKPDVSFIDSRTKRSSKYNTSAHNDYIMYLSTCTVIRFREKYPI